MYRSAAPGQLSFENFYLPFSGRLSADNRWVKLAALIPWELVEAEYAEQFSASRGAPAKTFRVALGALIIKEKLGSRRRGVLQEVQRLYQASGYAAEVQYADQVRLPLRLWAVPRSLAA